MICHCCENRIGGGGVLPSLSSQHFWCFKNGWWQGKSMHLETRQTWARTPALALTSLWPWADQSCRMSDLRSTCRELILGLPFRAILKSSWNAKQKGPSTVFSLQRVLNKCKCPLVPYQCPYFTLLCLWFSFLNITLLVSENQQWVWSKEEWYQGTNNMCAPPLSLPGGNISQI